MHLVDAADFHEFKLVWNEYFPSDPPARTTVEVGDGLPFHGARLNIDAVALATGSRLEPQVLRDPEGSDPVEAEGASHAVRAGNLVFCSAFTASDFKTGIAVGRRLGFPAQGKPCPSISKRERSRTVVCLIESEQGISDVEPALDLCKGCSFTVLCRVRNGV